MDITTSVAATGITVVAGQWSREKSIGIKQFFALGILAIFLAIMESENEKLAQQFAMLILVSAVLIYGVDIGKKLGGLNK